MRLLRTLFVSLALIVIGGVVLYAATDQLRAFTSEAARRIAVREHPVEVPPVTLETQSGARIDIADLRGKWLLVDFIYTRCPTYCVALGSEFAQLQDRLGGPLGSGAIELVSISFDPAHDTPRALAAYLQRAHSRGAGWVAARPVDSGGLDALERAFGITVIPDGLGGYTHNAAIHVVDPQGRLIEIVDPGQSDLAVRTVLQKLGP
jgi:protein SCO1/2